MKVTNIIPKLPQAHNAAAAPRYLAWTEHTSQPPSFARDEVRAWMIETQLGRAWDAQISPHELLATFAPLADTDAARAALDALFDAADDVRAAVEQQPDSMQFFDAADAHRDAMAALLEALTIRNAS